MRDYLKQAPQRQSGFGLEQPYVPHLPAPASPVELGIMLAQIKAHREWLEIQRIGDAREIENEEATLP